MDSGSPRRPQRQDTFDLRGTMVTDEHSQLHIHSETYPSDEEHSMLEDDSDQDERDGDYADDDDRSPPFPYPMNQSILIWSIHYTASPQPNSYWWLVRVLKTQEIGYIPAENIETPFERLARLNKHRNVDLASATQAEMQEGGHFRINMPSRAASSQQTPSPTSGGAGSRSRQHARRSVIFRPALQVHRYPPAVWGDDEEEDDDDEWDERRGGGGGDSDDGMSWEEELPDPSRARALAVAEEQRRQQELHAQQLQQQQLQQRQEAEEQAAQQQQQRQQIEEQRRQQQLIAQSMARQTPDTITQRSAGLSIHTSGSREQLVPLQETSASILLPHQEEERKRTREEIEALEEAARKKAKSPPAGRVNGGPANYARSRSRPVTKTGERTRQKGKSSGLLGRLFDRRKDKHKEKGSNGSIDISRSVDLRGSEESGRSSNHTDGSAGPQTPPRRGMAPVTAPSPPYLNMPRACASVTGNSKCCINNNTLPSPASPPEPQSTLQMSPGSPGLGVLALGNAASTLSPSSDGRRPRPGSLLIGGNISGDGSSTVPELSVIRIFAGKKLQTEATFKTVLLNSLTSSEELVKQAMQRFRLPAGEGRNGVLPYRQTTRRLVRSADPDEKPLIVFETLAEAALDLPKVKRSSVGSISSIASNLSQHPAIKKLPMNDFTDDGCQDLP
ncbi:hypothetical protein EDB87DRAFT_1762276 [Lactarius vividus]|nr:hypothetical protein EDB87DRAFT_1762276 [Lactarius vividus]